MKTERDMILYVLKDSQRLWKHKFKRILIDETALNEIIIPTMNVNRRLPDGSRHPEETTNKSQIYVTTAGYKGTFAYRKLIQTLIHSITDPNEAMVMGGTWRIPVLEGLLQRSFIDELKLDGTYNEASFDREYKKELYSLNIVNCWKPLTRKTRAISSQAA